MEEHERSRYWKDQRPQVIAILKQQAEAKGKTWSPSALEKAADVFIENMVFAKIDSVEEAISLL